MSLQTVEINSVKITFDKEKTKEYRTDFNKPCDCQDCRNYYENIKNNRELIDFLIAFGVDYLKAEEIMPYDLGNEIDPLIYYRAYYSVVGSLNSEFSTNQETFSVSFEMQNNVNVGHEISEDYFFIVIDINLPFILDEERELPPQSFAKKILNKVRSIIKKK